MTDRSFNGWLVLDQYPTATFTAPGGKTVYCNSREVAVVMEYWARRWHAEVEPIAASHPANWERPRERRGTTPDGKWDAVGIHSWRPPGTKVGTGNRSNHRSATCVDINGHLHPYEATVKTYNDGFTQAQRDKVRQIAHAPRDDAGRRIGRSGLDFARGLRDGMHIEIGSGPGVALITRTSVQQAAKRLENDVGRSSTAPVLWVGAYGHDVRALQGRLNRAGFDAGPEDGSAGAKFDAAVRALQKAAGITVDGRVGPGTREALVLAELGELLEPITEEAELMAAAEEIIAAVTAQIAARDEQMDTIEWAARLAANRALYQGPNRVFDRMTPVVREAANIDATTLAASIAESLLPEVVTAISEAGSGATAQEIVNLVSQRLAAGAPQED